MKPESHSINDVLSKNATSFFIPPFQRAYAWGKQEIERYFSDISRIIDSEVDNNQVDKLEHFFGTIVIKEEKSGFANKSVVVDGQQRITTTLLLLIALRDLEEDENNRDFITQNYLINNSSNFKDKIKLKQVTKDWEAYCDLVNNNNQSKNSIISNAYQLFRKLIENRRKINPDITLSHYIIALQRMNVAVIFLDERPFKGEDPQIIFETLNSLGRPLTLSDLVRNYILLKIESEKQTDIYEGLWYPQIECILKDNTSAFFRDFLQLKKSTPIKAISDNNTKEIYQIFKEFVDSQYDNHILFINDIVKYVRLYKWILEENINDIISLDSNNDNIIKELIRNIFHDIGSEAFKPIILGLLYRHQYKCEGKSISDNQFIGILECVRTYLIRRRILGLTQGENKNIVVLCNKIDDLIKGNVSMWKLLSNLFYRLRLPNNTEIRNALESMKFYEDIKKYSKFVLGKIEENSTKIAVAFRNPVITIEHIMPQTLSSEWKNELGENYKEIHDTYLHNIGNLILTEFNSEMGNKSFSFKKEKLKQSSLHYRLFVEQKGIWNEDSILEHRNMMINQFLETFPVPSENIESSNWNIRETENILFSPLQSDSGDIAEGNKPMELHVENMVVKVKTWQDVFIKFLDYIRNNQNYDFNLIVESQNDLSKKNAIIMDWKHLSKFLESNPDFANRYKTFDGKTYDNVRKLSEDELFIHINISASACMNRIATIMNIFNIDEDSIAIKLK